MCHLSPTPTAIATDPPPANSPTMHSTVGWFAKTDIFVLGNQPIYPKTKKRLYMYTYKPSPQKKFHILFFNFSNTLFDQKCLVNLVLAQLFRASILVGGGSVFNGGYLSSFYLLEELGLPFHLLPAYMCRELVKIFV